MGGFDNSFKNPFWQLLDFGARLLMFGKTIRLNPYFLVHYDTEIEPHRECFDSDYLLFVLKNQFVRNGVKKAVYEGSVNAGYSDAGALFNLLAEWNGFLKPYSINHLNTGRLIYSLEPGAEAKNVLTYRDFFTKKNYEIELNQMKTENPLKSSFFISVKVTDADGNRLAKAVGMPDFQRENVSGYFIRQVIISPDNKQIVFVVAKTVVIDGETSVRYMVETLSL